MSSLTAITYLPAAACSESAPVSARQTSGSGAPSFIVTMMNFRRLVSGSCIETLHHVAAAEHVAQVRGEHRLHRNALHQARLARRDLRDDRGQDRLRLARDRRDFHVRVVFLQVHVAVRFAERRLGLEVFRRDVAFDDDLGFGRNEQVDGFRAHDVDRRADEPAGNFELIERFGTFLRRRKRDGGRAAEHDGGGHASRRACGTFPSARRCRAAIRARGSCPSASGDFTWPR